MCHGRWGRFAGVAVAGVTAGCEGGLAKEWEFFPALTPLRDGCGVGWGYGRLLAGTEGWGGYWRQVRS